MTTHAQWQTMTVQQQWDYLRLLEDTVDALELDGDGSGSERRYIPAYASEETYQNGELVSRHEQGTNPLTRYATLLDAGFDLVTPNDGRGMYQRSIKTADVPDDEGHS